MKSFKIIRVVTKDLVTDSFQGIRSMFGLRLRGYEKMLNKGIDEAMNEMNGLYYVNWFRMIVNPLVNGSAMIVLYGEGEEK